MPITLSKKANEQSSYGVGILFLDSKGNPATPYIMKWTLTDSAGNLIREEMNYNPSSSEDIVLFGDDLKFNENSDIDEGMRILTIESEYNSNIGSNLPLKEEIIFYIHDLQNVL